MDEAFLSKVQGLIAARLRIDQELEALFAGNGSKRGRPRKGQMSSSRSIGHSISISHGTAETNGTSHSDTPEN